MLAFSYLPIAIFATDADLRVTEANPAAEALLKKPWRELHGKTLTHLFGSEPSLIGLAQDTLRHGTMCRLQQMTLRLSSDIMHATLHLAPIWPSQIEEEVPVGVVIAIDPMQHEEQFQRRRTQQDRSKTAGLAAAMLAHEIKNPLASIRSAAQLIAQDHPTKLTEVVVKESDRIAAMMQRLEYLSHEGSPTFAPVNIHEVLRYVLSVLPQFASCQLIERFDPSLPEVAGDRDLLIQLFLNLAKNAVEAMQTSPAPSLTLRTYCAPDFRLHDGTKRILPLIVEIEDNGPGIAPEIAQSLFTPFVTTKRGGNGLGLVIAAKIANDHGGSIDLLQSGPGKTVFRVTLQAF